MQPDPERPDLSLSVDVLAPEGYGEIIGGGQRVDDYDTLLERLRAHDLPAETFEWYLDLRRYGSVPHGGSRTRSTFARTSSSTCGASGWASSASSPGSAASSTSAKPFRTRACCTGSPPSLAAGRRPGARLPGPVGS